MPLMLFLFIINLSVAIFLSLFGNYFLEMAYKFLNRLPTFNSMMLKAKNEEKECIDCLVFPRIL